MIISALDPSEILTASEKADELIYLSLARLLQCIPEDDLIDGFTSDDFNKIHEQLRSKINLALHAIKTPEEVF